MVTSVLLLSAEPADIIAGDSIDERTEEGARDDRGL